MGSRAKLCLTALVGALLGTAGVATAATPALAPLAGAFAGPPPPPTSLEAPPSVFFTDGRRFATFSDAAGRLVALDAQTNHRSTIPLAACGFIPLFAPIGMAPGVLITNCYKGTYLAPVYEYQLFSLTKPGSRPRTIRFAPPADITNPSGPGAVGADWAEFLGGGDGDHVSSMPGGSQLFNLTTGAIAKPLPTPSAREYLDLSSPRPVRRLCAPVTTNTSPAEGFATVVGVERPWVVLAQHDAADISRATLLAWRCGSRAPIRIGSETTGGAQFAAGILTWTGADNSVHAENLANRRRLDWAPPPNGDTIYAALHTARRIFVAREAPPGSPSVLARQPIYTASLSALLRR